MGAEELKPYLTQYVESITTKSKVGLYNCPLCASGTGKNKSGAFSIKGDLWSCFSCNQHGDTVDLIKLHENISDTGEAIRWGQEHFNITGKAKPVNKKEVKQVSEQDKQAQGQDKEKQLLSFFINSLQDTTEAMKYMAKRGISEQVAKRFNVGYVENYGSAGACVIIPTSTTSYMAREINGDKKRNSKGEIKLFNLAALDQTKQPIFIVEGSIDAMSIAEVGGEAIGLNGVDGYKKLLEEIEQTPTEQPLILCMDNDKAGKEAQETLAKELYKQKVKYYECAITGENKDPNEALKADRKLFEVFVDNAKKQAYIASNELEEVYKQEAKEFRRDYAATSLIPKLEKEIEESANRELITTGFANVDKILDGGLYTGLYILGAGSSIGKTTFVLQIADQLAKSGQDVLIFSLEMAATELVAKSLSRITDELSNSTGEHNKYSCTFRGIVAGQNYASYNDTQKLYIENSKAEYKKYSNNIFIEECIFNFTIEQLKEKLETHIKITGKKPIVILDYLQIIEPINEKYTDKQNADKTIKALKIISRSYDIPLVAISSLNRASYGKAVTMQSFKESGGIEYGSDVLLALELSEATDEESEMKIKGKEERKVKLKVLKNRNGKIGEEANFTYFALYNRFVEE